MKLPLVVVIPTHGRSDLLQQTLESIVNCKLPRSFEELIVIENGSRAGADSLLEELPDRLRARYMHRERGNKSYALNEALETIDDGLVVFFDDDVRVDPSTLMAYAKAAADYNSGIFLGGTVRVQKEVEPPRWLKPSLPDSATGYIADGSREGKYYLGFNWAAFSEDIKQLGGFDPRFGPGSTTGATGQESDMQQRMRTAGLKPVDVADAVVTHHVPKERCTLPWAVGRRYQAGIFGYHKSGGGIHMLAKALRIFLEATGLIAKSIATAKWGSAAFGLARIGAGLGIVRGFLQGYQPPAFHLRNNEHQEATML
jgi:glycosyltransferase involved in cell wall biosynthesis